MRLDLPFPHKLLWPNGSRGTHRAVAGQKAKHKQWAWGAAMAQRDRLSLADGPVAVRLIVRAKAKGPLPDKDNCIAALKAYQDGISQAIGIDDKHFREPSVTFAEPRDGRFIVEIGQ